MYFCWFLVAFGSGIYVIYLAVQACMRKHSVPGLLFYNSSGVIVLTIVTGVACLLILAGKSASSGWAVAACVILTFSWVPDTRFESWRGALEAGFARWPWILFGLVGITIFCILYRGWRDRTPMLTE